MDDPQILDLLEELAESLGLRISYEPIKLDEELGTRPGGFCLLKGQRIVIINPQASIKEKIRIVSGAIRQFDLDQIYIRPVLRELLDTIPEQKPPVVNGNDDQKDGDKPMDAEE
jgi:hypothetical protein